MGSGSSKATHAGKAHWQPAGPDTPRRVSAAGYDITAMTLAQREAAAAKLTPHQRAISLESATEPAFTGSTVDGSPWNEKRRGLWLGAVSNLPLFSSETKYESGTGWPSFYAPIDEEHLIEVEDRSMALMPRVEVIDAKSGAHLGHVFSPERTPTGKRYCMNAAALRFVPEGQPLPPEARPMAAAGTQQQE